MISENGSSNGNLPDHTGNGLDHDAICSDNGGSGGIVTQQMIDDLESRHHRRESLNILRQSIEKGWTIPPEYKDTCPKVLMAIMADPKASKRDKISANRVLATFNAQNVQAFEVLDKADRLDSGDHTEIIGISSERRVRLDRIAERIDGG